MDSQLKARSSIALCVLLILLIATGPLGLWMLQVEKSRWVELRVMTFNIRQGMAKDGDNHWEFRKDLVCDVIRENSPDVIGMQEVYRFQLDDILQRLPEYGAVGTGRDGGDKGEYVCILYRIDRFDVVESNTFWLSDTPTIPSTSWGNSYRRICTWARLVDKHCSRSFTLYNTHLDHQSLSAKENGIRLIMQTIAASASADPFILFGDFNSEENSKVVRYLKGAEPLQGNNPIPLIDSWRVLHSQDSDCGTISRFTGSMDPMKIDYILSTPDTQVLSSQILRVNRNGRYPSDHYPVAALLRLK